MCARGINSEIVQNFQVATKKVYQEENYEFFVETDFSRRTLVVIKISSSTSKLSETLHNSMISVMIAVPNA